MPTLTLTFTTEAGTRLADAIVFERPDLTNASNAEKAEAVRQKVISMLKMWCLQTERRKSEIELYQTLNNTPPDLT